MGERIYELEHVSYCYKKAVQKANDDISFPIYKGEIIGILGPNGAGKTTLIKQMMGQLAPTSGTIKFQGQDILNDTKHLLKQVAYYSQETFALSFLKVWESLYFTGRLRGLTRNEAKCQTEGILERLDMNEYRHTLLKSLSGGQRRLIGLGTALIGHASIMILDEPTNELDPLKRKLVWEIIQEQNQKGVTIILVTHNILEAEKVVHRVAVINHGKLLAIDHVTKLKERVDQRMRLEVITQDESSLHIQEQLGVFGEIERMEDTKFRILIEKKQVASAIESIQDDRFNIRQFSLLPPSLEDVYSKIHEQKVGEWL
ncbi:ABC transporter ATP-binding protein [Lysinibacillus antri]|uniref:ABC transporter ATP-binding protein n=1 Tax=Lysinibacillus antri TaxID=2498145 RepID=A0A3S0RUL1_9BACI|nr:ABC transporter ATP-binding protein [Lysinibacillus antri]RUL50342.1 ABC transporter ATP-binding protein [Lysinibacillus antri]